MCAVCIEISFESMINCPTSDIYYSVLKNVLYFR